MLPWVEEVRAARAKVAEAQRAMLDLAEVDGVLLALDLCRVRGRVWPDDPGLVDRLIGAWPELSSAPREPRLAFFEAARRRLRPTAHATLRLVDEMQALQIRQQEALVEPEHAELARQLQVEVQERDAWTAELAPLERRAAVLDPTIATLRDLAGRLEAGLAEADLPDPRGVTAWRVASLARVVVESLDAVLREVEVDVALPASPTVGPRADAATAEAHLIGARNVATGMSALLDELEARRAALRSTVRPLRERLDRRNAELLERLG